MNFETYTRHFKLINKILYSSDLFLFKVAFKKIRNKKKKVLQGIQY